MIDFILLSTFEKRLKERKRESLLMTVKVPEVREVFLSIAYMFMYKVRKGMIWKSQIF